MNPSRSGVFFFKVFIVMLLQLFQLSPLSSPVPSSPSGVFFFEKVLIPHSV